MPQQNVRLWRQTGLVIDRLNPALMTRSRPRRGREFALHQTAVRLFVTLLAMASSIGGGALVPGRLKFSICAGRLPGDSLLLNPYPSPPAAPMSKLNLQLANERRPRSRGPHTNHAGRSQFKARNGNYGISARISRITPA